MPNTVRSGNGNVDTAATFDRVNKHRYPLIGYQGVINMVTEICNKFIDIKDETCEDRFFEMMR